jgi:hypothetical protein
MDPKSSYLLEIRLNCNHEKRRKDILYFSFNKVMDSNLCNFKDLVEEIVNQYPPSYLKVVHIFYYDEVKKCFPQVTTDYELLEMFSKHVEKKVLRMTIAYTDPIDAMPIPKCYTLENSDVLDIPCTPSMACPSLATASQSNEPICSQYSKPKTVSPLNLAQMNLMMLLMVLNIWQILNHKMNMWLLMMKACT